MRLSTARAYAGGGRAAASVNEGWDPTTGVHGAAWRRAALALSVVLVLGAIGILFGPAKPAAADGTLFQSGQVFASVGNSLVSVYSQSSGNPLIATLNDGLNEPYTAGSAFDSSGNFYVTDDYAGDVSEYSPSGALDGVFASGLQNPLSLAFDNQGNLYVGQQTTPYIAEFSSTGQFVKDIGPLATELSGDDWIALAPDECTFYYTTEETDILRYNMCTGQQLANFNVQPFPTVDPTTGYPVSAYELQILPDGDVLVADSNADILLDQNGNVLQTYTCASLPGCQGQLFAISLDPDGTSFWTGDANSGNVWEVNIATGAVQQQIDTHSGALFGLSVDDEVEVAAPATVTTATPSTLAIQPVSGDFSSPTPVSAVLTNPATGQPIANEPVTFTLNGSESCTGTTDDTGSATCVITPGEPASSYTLTASFGGDTSTSTPIGSNSSSSTFTVNPDTSSVTYSGATERGQRPARDPVGDPFDQHPEHGHRAADQGRHLHHRFGFDRAVVQCDDRRQRERQLHHCGRRPALGDRDRDDVVRRRLLRHRGEHHLEPLGQRTDHADGQRREREFQRVHHGVGHPQRHQHRASHLRRAGDLRLEQLRHRDLHRNDERPRRGVVLHHARRGTGDLHLDRLLRRGHLPARAAHVEHQRRPPSSRRRPPRR